MPWPISRHRSRNPEWLRAVFEEVARLLDGMSLVGLPEHEARRRIEALGLQWYPVYETTTAIDASLQPRRVMATVKDDVMTLRRIGGGRL